MKRFVKYLYFKFLLRDKGVYFSYSSSIGINSQFEGTNKLCSGSFFCGKMGYGSYIGENCFVFANIGRFTSIAPYVRTNHGVHPFLYPFVTTSPMFYSLAKQNGKTFAKKNMFNEHKYPPEIGNDCWIGENVFISGGVNICDGAVVLAGAVVTTDIPPYAVAGGVPAKVLRYRYDEDTIRFLLKIKWWNKDLEWLNCHWDLLCDMEKLKEYFAV